MAITHQMITYRLTENGAVPNFLYKGNDGIGGVFVVSDPQTPFPQDNIMFGLSEYPITAETSGIVNIFNTKEEMEAYLTEIFAGKMEPVGGSGPGGRGPDAEMQPVDVAAKVEWVWGIYTARNGL